MKYTIYEISFFGTKAMFSTDSENEAKLWFLERGLTKHPNMMDAGYYMEELIRPRIKNKPAKRRQLFCTELEEFIMKPVE